VNFGKSAPPAVASIRRNPAVEPHPMFEVRPSLRHGRGVFATTDIPRDTRVHVAHVLALDCRDSATVAGTRLGAYVFDLGACPCECGRRRFGVAFSPISFANHDVDANADFDLDPAALRIEVRAARDIAAGEEVTIDYGPFAAELGLPTAR
jgi:hypothetical protein